MNWKEWIGFIAIASTFFLSVFAALYCFIRAIDALFRLGCQ